MQLDALFSFLLGQRTAETTINWAVTYGVTFQIDLHSSALVAIVLLLIECSHAQDSDRERTLLESNGRQEKLCIPATCRFRVTT